MFGDDDRARYVGSLAREEEIRSSFADGWRVVSIDLVTTSVLFSEQGIPAWLAVIERA